MSHKFSLGRALMHRSAARRGVIMEQHKEPALSRDIKIVCTPPAPLDKLTPKAGIEEVSAAEIVAYAKAAAILDEHDGEPLWKKLESEAGSGAFLLVDAMDDEPYVSSQLGPMLSLRDECVSGLRLAQKATAGKNAEILVYKNIAALETAIPAKVCGVRIRRIGGAYPAEVYSSLRYADDSDTHYVTIGACALIHLHRAVFEARKQTTAFVTVAGNCVGTPRNLEIDIGSTAEDAFNICGLIDEPTRIVAGGSITGHAVADTETLTIDPCTRALLAFREDERDRHFECIGCGDCIRCCPAGINPMMIYKALRAGRYDLCETLEPQRCIGCMTCSYVCCAKLDIAAEIETYLAQGGKTE